MSEIILSDDKALLDVVRIHGWLASSYWSPGIARDLVERAIAGSHCLGAYRGDEQIGYARMITDHATFAWLADVWVDESVRGQGLGRQLVAWFLEHPRFQGIRRFALATRDAHGVYAAMGYHALIEPGLYMERLASDHAARVKTGR
jgi:GNAT superfamily N-acetyltransferase